MPGPVASDFTIAQSGGAGTDVVVTRTVSIPLPAVTWTIDIFDNGVEQGAASDTVVSVSLGVFPAGHVVGAKIAWSDVFGNLLSEYSPMKTVTTI
jgi:hypothetical protein